LSLPLSEESQEVLCFASFPIFGFSFHYFFAIDIAGDKARLVDHDRGSQNTVLAGTMGLLGSGVCFDWQSKQRI
jgi:hypothetical protein